MTRKLLVTSALPYANGHIHLGHLVEYIQTDIWVRFQKQMGHTCHYMCADDTHGTPIMQNAKKAGVTPEAFIEQFHVEHLNDFKSFNIEFDHYGSTHTDENRVLSESIYDSAKQAGAIYEKEIDQFYCKSCDMFLPDRFIKGTCPSCGAEEQYGDACEACSSTYEPTELKDPHCAECSESPVLKTSNHYFFKLSQFKDQVTKWVQGGAVRQDVQNKLNEWLEGELRDWDISRDAPYFGFKIPGSEEKYFYVWLDAPVGYISTTQIWGKESGHDHLDIWKGDDYEIHHFIGKDILYFHTLFWPAMLTAAEYSLPKKVHIHGFLTVNGQKMSKSRGTFILASEYMKYSNPEFLRYYYAAKLNGTMEDIDFNLEDFVNRINSDVLGKVVNIASRLASIVNKKCGGTLSTLDDKGQKLLQDVLQQQDDIQADYENVHFHKAMMKIMKCADLANKYIDENAPWQLVKEDQEAALKVCTSGLNVLRVLCVYLAPVLPEITEKLFGFLNTDHRTYSTISHALENHAIAPYEHVAKRFALEDIEALTTVSA